MAGGVAHIVEVVVLAAGAHAFLRRDGAYVRALLQAGKDVLELHHPGIGEHQGRVVARDQRRRRHDLVPARRKIIQEGRPNVVDAAHEISLSRWCPALRPSLYREFACNGIARNGIAAPRIAAYLPLPIVLHDGERAGVRGRCPHRRLNGAFLYQAANTTAPQSPHVALPLTLTLSPRREERRGERGRAHSSRCAKGNPSAIDQLFYPAPGAPALARRSERALPAVRIGTPR